MDIYGNARRGIHSVLEIIAPKTRTNLMNWSLYVKGFSLYKEIVNEPFIFKNNSNR